ncbi:MAG: hypothetical protein RLZZ76_418 [Candidatus Parcubacteria bacterium]|jgi:hypothetical protein
MAGYLYKFSRIWKANTKKYFLQNHCRWFVIDDKGNKIWKKVGIDSELGFKVFCHKCDSRIFEDIDNPDSNLNVFRNQFLYTFRVLAYQHQFNKITLAIAHQVAILSPTLVIERNLFLNTQKNNEVIDMTHLVESYIRYSLTYSELEKIYNSFLANKIESARKNFVDRDIDIDEIFFAQAI